ncbi:MAG: hypothetical protein ACK47N_23140 [Microcystis sp.]
MPLATLKKAPIAPHPTPITPSPHTPHPQNSLIFSTFGLFTP